MLKDVLDHYNRAAPAPGGHTELKPLKLNARELHQIESFLRSLSSGTAAAPELLRAPRLRERGPDPDRARSGVIYFRQHRVDHP